MSFNKQLGARRGVTLIEAVLFISIALGLIVGGLVFFQQASLAQRTNDAVRSISSLASETRAAYRTQQDFEGVDSEVLINSGAVPSSAINGSEIRNEWGGDAVIAANLVNEPINPQDANEFFSITYTEIPQAACVRLGTATDGTGPVGAGVVAMQVVEAGDAITNAAVFGTASADGQADVTPVNASEACAAAGDTVDLRITFIR